MKLVCDPAKQAANLKKHGLDFAGLTVDFFSTAIVETARDGRFKAIGSFEGRLITVIFRLLGTEAIGVISMRSASRAERRLLK